MIWINTFVLFWLEFLGYLFDLFAKDLYWIMKVMFSQELRFDYMDKLFTISENIKST